MKDLLSVITRYAYLCSFQNRASAQYAFSAQFSGKGFGCQHAGVYSRTVAIELNVTDSEGRKTDLLWLRVEMGIRLH